MGQSVQKFLVERLRREQTGKAVLSPWEARRIIATSQMELDELVKNGTLLPSLAEHFNVLTLRMPSLSEREKDVLELARHFVSTTNSDHIPPLKGLTVGAEHVLMSYDWPGNVRELRSVIERAVSVSQGPYITADDLRMRSVAAHAEEMTGEEPLSSLKEIEVRQIRRVLAFTEGDITRAAAILGISRKSLWERRKRYSIS
jgi:DNA-binding NtrC family response regulator